MSTDEQSPTLTVWRFGSATGAAQAARTLEEKAAAGLVVAGAAAVSWPRRTRSPQVEQLTLPAAPGLLGEDFWGLVFGLVFFMPLIGAAVGATTGSRAGTLADVGIDDTFISKVRDRVTPGTSALFTLTSGDDPEAVRSALSARKPAEVLFTLLTPAQLQALRTVFGRP